MYDKKKLNDELEIKRNKLRDVQNLIMEFDEKIENTKIKAKKNKLLNILYLLIKLENVLKIQISDIYSKIEVLDMKDWNLIGTNKQIALYKTTDGISGRYLIYLHNSSIEIGLLEYNSNDNESIYGDISGYIDDEYHVYGYAYQGLVILMKYLQKNNVKKVRISSNKDNLSSIKTIEKLCNEYSDFSQYVEDDIIINDFKLKKKKLK